MKKKIRVVIVDDNVTFGNLLHDFMGRYDDIDVVGVARDGLQAIEMINELEPDFLILDIIMPNLDGIGVLEKISSLEIKKKPLIIMLSAIGQDVFVQKAISLGADYYVVKPFDIGVLVSRIRQIYEEKPRELFSFHIGADLVRETKNSAEDFRQNIEIEATDLMREAGIPPHMVGYQYIREAIIRSVLNNSRIFSSITKVVYPEVAQKFNTTPKRVERAIRNAIESSMHKMLQRNNNQFYSFRAGKVRTKPTNAEFIAMLADRVRMNLGIKN